MAVDHLDQTGGPLGSADLLTAEVVASAAGMDHRCLDLCATICFGDGVVKINMNPKINGQNRLKSVDPIQLWPSYKCSDFSFHGFIFQLAELIDLYCQNSKIVFIQTVQHSKGKQQGCILHTRQHFVVNRCQRFLSYSIYF